MPLLRGLSILERLAWIFEISAGILTVGIEEEAVEAFIQVVVLGDVASGAPPVIALVQVAKRHARLIQGLTPESSLQFGEIAGAKLQQAVKIALGDDDPSVHVKFAEAQRGIEHQLPLGRPIKNFDPKDWTRPVAEDFNSSVGGFDFEPTFANQSMQIGLENRVHHSHSPFRLYGRGSPKPDPSVHYVNVSTYGKFQGLFKC